MLVPDNIRPDLSIYYNGSFILQVLQKDRIQNILDLYTKVREIKEMSFSVFILCLDWLYLIDVAYLNYMGDVELCS